MPQAKALFTVILEPENDGGYSVHCPALPGCVSEGENREDALTNIKEAIALVLRTLEQKELVEAHVFEAFKGNETGPHETPDLVASEIREVLAARREERLPLTIETVVVEITSTVSA